jgi:AcrR family transcriptional regulator
MGTDDRYHHGDLPTAVLAAVDEIVRERDVAGLSLREVARRAGVSHAAPAHHFGDKAGVVTAYATEGFEILRDRLARAGRDAASTDQRELLMIGLAYIRFAVDEPGRFRVMFRPEHVREEDPGYQRAREGAFGVLVAAVRELRPELDPDGPELLSAATGAWSIVHGFATLWLDSDLPSEITAHPAEDAAAAALLQFGATLLAAIGAEAPLAAPWPELDT